MQKKARECGLFCRLHKRSNVAVRRLGLGGLRAFLSVLGDKNSGDPSSGQTALCPSGIKLLPDGSDCLLVEVVVPHRPNAYQGSR